MPACDVVVVGVAAACADFFTLSAYARGLKITSLFKDPFTWLELLAVALIVTGIFLLQREEPRDLYAGSPERA